MNWNKETILTFNEPVEVPGVALPANKPSEMAAAKMPHTASNLPLLVMLGFLSRYWRTFASPAPPPLTARAGFAGSAE